MRKESSDRSGPPLVALGALLFAAALCGISCDLPEIPGMTETMPETALNPAAGAGPGGGAGTGAGAGTLTLILPGTKAAGAAAGSRSVLSAPFIDSLKYRLIITGDPGTTVLEADGGGTTISLREGTWTINAEAYVSSDPGTAVGSGSTTVTIVAGENVSKTISMTVDPEYEKALTDIYIHNEAELRRIGAAENGLDIDTAGRTFYLEDDIVLTQPWTPIGSPGESPSPDKPFKAVFDGQGHTITVSSFAPAKKAGNAVFQGFFALAEDATIKNLTLKYELDGTVDISTGDGSTYYDSYAGGVAGKAGNTGFEKIQVQVTGNFAVKADGDSGLHVGGIAGSGGDVTITDCRVTGAIGGNSANYLTIGGITGMINNNSPDGNISGSFFVGNLSGYTAAGNCEAGGIAGRLSNTEVSACFAEGHIKAEAATPSAGGIAGAADGVGGVKKSYAAGAIESVGDDYSYAGGIIASLEGAPITIENCYSWADVSSSADTEEAAGGIAGSNQGQLSISKCYAAGKVRSGGQNPDTHVGGIVGRASSGGILETIGACMALVSELDAGLSSSPLRNAYKISPAGSLTGNYSLGSGDIQVWNYTNNPDPGPSNKDGEAKPLADFKSQAAPNVYTTAGWNFADGDWKWPPSGWEWDYPVPSWQPAAPGVALEESSRGEAGLEIEWP